MPPIELPHTPGCIVCGRENVHGLHLSLHVDTQSGIVSADFTPRPEHIGFEGIVHGGVLATVLDEAMVWAATWAGKRFCVCGELNVRYRQSGRIGVPIQVKAKIEAVRSRLIETSGSIMGTDGTIFCTATGKYVPVPPQRNVDVVNTLVADPNTKAATELLGHAAQSGG
jgi:uncharacterized protein (TIGR00369 family)